MSISSAKLAILADYYGFDLHEAREYIGLPPLKTGGRTEFTVAPVITEKKARTCSLCGEKGHNKITCTKNAKPNHENPIVAKSKNNGFKNYVKAKKDKVTKELQSNATNGKKVTNEIIIKMLEFDWKALSDNSRQKWNN